MNAKGTFEITLSPVDISFSVVDELAMDRLSINKVYHGELKGNSVGEMLSVKSSDANAGYVAIEQFKGVIFGKEGSFALQHFGTMTPVSEHLNLVIIPGSGRGELSGISGSMKLTRKDGVHHYELDFLI